MKELLGKKIVAVDERRENSPFFRLLLDDGSLLSIAYSGRDALQVDYITDAEKAFELSGGMMLDSHSDLAQRRLRGDNASSAKDADAQASVGATGYGHSSEDGNNL